MPREKIARLHSQSAATATKATPLITRCVNSMMVSMRGASGTTSPLHSGQWLPHPAPDPLARTKAPHKTTSIFHASTPQAKRVKFAVRVGAGDMSCGSSIYFNSYQPLLESWVRSRNVFPRTSCCAHLAVAMAGSGVAQSNKKLNPDAGYIPVVAPEGKKKKKGDETTQALAAPPELPAAVTAETDRLTYQVYAAFVQRSAFAADARCVESFARVQSRTHREAARIRRRLGRSAARRRDRGRNVPGKTSAAAGVERRCKWARCRWKGAQVVIEATEVDRKVVNPAGVAFLAAQPAASVGESIDKLKSVLAGAGMQPADALADHVLRQLARRSTRHAAGHGGELPRGRARLCPDAARPVMPAADCEAVARLAQAGARAIRRWPWLSARRS